MMGGVDEIREATKERWGEEEERSFSLSLSDKVQNTQTKTTVFFD